MTVPNMSTPYRTAWERDEGSTGDATPEAVLYDTLQRLNDLDEDDARRVVRGLAAFIGFNVGPETIGSDLDEDVDE